MRPTCLFLVLTGAALFSSCGGGKGSGDPSDSSERPQFEYRVLTEASIDRLIYDAWFKQGIAEPLGNSGQIRILDVQRANSEVTMPAILNAFGAQGWELAGISATKLYIFVREKRAGDEASEPAPSGNTATKPPPPPPTPAAGSDSSSEKAKAAPADAEPAAPAPKASPAPAHKPQSNPKASPVESGATEPAAGEAVAPKP